MKGIFSKETQEFISKICEKVRNGDLFLYEIIADYRPNNERKPRYFVVAKNVNEAKKRFARSIDYMKIYEIGVVKDIDLAISICSSPFQFAVMY